MKKKKKIKIEGGLGWNDMTWEGMECEAIQWRVNGFTACMDLSLIDLRR
jgi:hypothetical protein